MKINIEQSKHIKAMLEALERAERALEDAYKESIDETILNSNIDISLERNIICGIRAIIWNFNTLIQEIKR